jgi:CarboxypepD_reg-like domain/TonB-dependent Receptor Plug Domain
MKPLKYITIICFLLFINKELIAQTDTAQKISLHLNNASYLTLVKNIESQTEFHFFYDSALFASKSFTINIDNAPISQVLSSLLNPQNIYFNIDKDGHIFLSKDPLLNLVLTDGYFTGKLTNTKVQEHIGFNDPEENINAQEALTDKNLYIIGEKNQAGATIVNMAGYIKDAKNGEPIAGASIYIDKPRIGVTSDQNGYYSISLPRGRHLLHIQSLGIRDINRQVLLYSDGKMNIEGIGSIMTLKKVIISSQKLSNVRGSVMGVAKLDIKTVKQIPVVFGEADILRAVTTLPGVKTVGEASTGLNVRGGATDQNLILFNDATIYNPSHFFGMFSSFNPELINNVELYKSSIPANFGGRLSSVLDINSREGNKKEFTGSAGIGLLTSRVNIEGPIEKDKSSFILGGRSTYSNWLFNLLPDAYKNSKADFYDLNLLINNKIDKNNTIYFTGYISNDHFNLNSDTAYGYGNKNISLKWKHIFNNKFNSLITGGWDNYSYQINSQKLPISAYQLSFGINQSYFKAHFVYNINSKHNVDFGVNSLLYNLSPGTYEPLGSKSLVVKDVIANEQAIENALYATDHYNINSKLKLDAGVRLSMYSALGPNAINTYPTGSPRTVDNIVKTIQYPSGSIIKTYGGPEFRIGLRYVIDETMSLKAGYNSQRQYIHSLSNTTAMAPTDIWKLSDPNIKPQVGDQISFGIYKNLKSNTIETSLEVYYKNMENYLDYKSGAKLVMNHHIETDVMGTQGKAYGVEFLVKKIAGKLNGWISYTWSRTLLKMNDPTAGVIINKGEYYPSNYDKPHDFTLIANYKFNHRFSISLNTNYSTGRPITLPIGVFSYGGALRTLYADRNAYRIPDYFRTDFSMNIEGNHKINQLTHNSWSIGVYNLTGQRNPYSIYYVSEKGAVNGYKLSIFGAAIPYINLNIRFK